MGPGSRPGRREIVASAPYISFTGLKSQTALQTYLRDLAASSARGLPGTSCPQTWRAQGRPGARCTRGLVCNVHLKKSAHEHTGSAETLRPSLRDGFTAYFVLSPVTGLCCHRRSREALASWKLDTSVGVSGPHDFAVRNNIARPHARSARRYHRVHRIPRPTSVTIAIRPSCGRETGELIALICPTAKAEYFL